MIPGHHGYTERRNREWNPRTEPTPRERDVLRAISTMPEGTRACGTTIAAVLNISVHSVHRHRTQLLALGLITITGRSSKANLELTEAGRKWIAQ